MKLLQTSLNGVFRIELSYFSDLRGKLLKPFSQARLNEAGLTFLPKETWFTFSRLNVIRGMHMQTGQLACAKVVTVLSGSIDDVVLDARLDSPSYGEFISLKIDSDTPQALYIPPGCSHGYRVMKDNTIVCYMADQPHVAKDDVGYLWNSFGYHWGIEDPILSDRDKELPPFGGVNKL